MGIAAPRTIYWITNIHPMWFITFGDLAGARAGPFGLSNRTLDRSLAMRGMDSTSHLKTLTPKLLPTHHSFFLPSFIPLFP